MTTPRWQRWLSGASFVLVGAATMYSAAVGLFGTRQVTVTSGQPLTESFSLSPAGLVAVLASIFSLVAVRRGDIRTLWVAAVSVLVVSVLFLFSIGTALLPVSGALVVAAALMTLVAKRRRTTTETEENRPAA